MSGRIAFLHPLEVRVKTFGDLVSALAPSAHVDQVVGEQLLAVEVVASPALGVEAALAPLHQ